MSPLKAALDAIEPEALQGNRREAMLLTTYAFAAEAAKNAVTNSENLNDTQLAALARAYAGIMRELEMELGKPPTVLGRASTAQTVQYVSHLPKQGQPQTQPTQ